VMPFTPHDAKGLLTASIKDENPVIFIEHRWLHNLYGEVPEESFSVPIGQARIAKEGKDITIVSMSHMTLEALKAADHLAKENIDTEVIDLRSLKPLDEKTIIDSVKKTGRLIVVDGAWRFLSISSEIISIVVEKAFSSLKVSPCRITFPDFPTPTSWALANHYYPRAINIINQAQKLLGLQQKSEEALGIVHTGPLDVPDKSFTGPF
jgi:pyruvate/2-oxoglutarate/acetoin dehydrogenase E1 component